MIPGPQWAETFRQVTIRGIWADGDTVIVVWDGCGIANNGQPYENSYAWIMKLADGKVVDGTAFCDSISFNDLRPRRAPMSGQHDRWSHAVRGRTAKGGPTHRHSAL